MAVWVVSPPSAGSNVCPSLLIQSFSKGEVLYSFRSRQGVPVWDV